MMGMQPGANGPMGVMPGGQHPGMPTQPGQPGQGMGGQSMAGGMPNAHALSHLTTQQMMQQQHLQQQSESYYFPRDRTKVAPSDRGDPSQRRFTSRAR